MILNLLLCLLLCKGSHFHQTGSQYFLYRIISVIPIHNKNGTSIHIAAPSQHKHKIKNTTKLLCNLPVMPGGISCLTYLYSHTHKKLYQAICIIKNRLIIFVHRSLKKMRQERDFNKENSNHTSLFQQTKTAQNSNQFFLFSSLNRVGVIPFDLLKGSTKIPRIRKTDLIGYFINVHISICKQKNRLLNTQPINIIINSQTGQELHLII